MYLIIISILTINLILRFYKLFKINKKINLFLSLKREIKLEPLKNNYMLLIPGYKEQAIVEETIKYCNSLYKLSKDIKFIFITSFEESNSIDISTRKKIENLLKKYGKLSKNVIILENEKPKHENKSKKINYAISILKEKYKLDDYIIGILDFDARFYKKELLYLDKLVSTFRSDNKTVLFQFVPIPIIKSKSLIPIIGGVYHLSRVFGYEFYNLYLEYCMGASMFIKGSYLKDNYIPEPIDDIPLGYRLIIKGYNKITIPYFTYVSIPNNSKDIFNQMIPIYHGVFSYFKELRQIKSINIKNILKGYLIYSRIMLEYIVIIFYFLLLFYNIEIFIVFSLFYCIERLFYIYYYNKVSESKLNIVFACLFLPGMALRFIIFVYFLLNSLFSFKNLYTIKTSR